jgi:hypothetical protein
VRAETKCKATRRQAIFGSHGAPRSGVSWRTRALKASIAANFFLPRATWTSRRVSQKMAALKLINLSFWSGNEKQIFPLSQRGRETETSPPLQYPQGIKGVRRGTEKVQRSFSPPNGCTAFLHRRAFYHSLYPLPFKGRARVGMGLTPNTHPPRDALPLYALGVLKGVYKENTNLGNLITPPWPAKPSHSEWGWRRKFRWVFAARSPYSPVQTPY